MTTKLAGKLVDALSVNVAAVQLAGSLYSGSKRYGMVAAVGSLPRVYSIGPLISVAILSATSPQIPNTLKVYVISVTTGPLGVYTVCVTVMTYQPA